MGQASTGPMPAAVDPYVFQRDGMATDVVVGGYPRCEPPAPYAASPAPLTGPPPAPAPGGPPAAPFAAGPPPSPPAGPLPAPQEGDPLSSCGPIGPPIGGPTLGGPTLAPAPPAWREPRRRAVVVGVGYTGNCDLAGTRNDAELWAQAVVKLGVDQRDVRVLGQDALGATRDEIWSAIKWLFLQACAGDTLMLVYLGHATEVPADTGGVVSCLLPSDFATLEEFSFRGVAPRWIPMPWIAHEVSKCPAGVDVVLMLDTSVSPLDLGTPQPAEVSRRPAAARVQGRFVTIDPEPQVGLKTFPSPPPPANVFCFTASAPGEVAVECAVDGKARGLFTTAICKALRDGLRRRDRLSYQELLDASTQGLRRLQQRGHGVCASIGFSHSASASAHAPFLNFKGDFHDTTCARSPGCSSASTVATSTCSPYAETPPKANGDHVHWI